MAASRRESSISLPRRRTLSASRTVSRAPMGAPRSEMKSSESCTRRPFSISISREGTSWRMANASSTMRPMRVESLKTSSAVDPIIWLRATPRKRSAEALTSTMRPSCVKSTRPSCRVDISWSRFSFRAEKTSRTSCIWRPSRSMRWLTAPISSVRLGNGSESGSGLPVSEVTASRRRAMTSSGCSA